MKLYNTKTNTDVEAEIIQIDLKELKKIEKSKRFGFKWVEEKEYAVYKIVEVETSLPLGLMSIIDYPEEYRIHINLIENSHENKGKKKVFDKVAGCLLAYAAQLSFESKYGGFTSLVPKTELIELYVKKYGFKQLGRQLALDGMDAVRIINKYL